MPTYQYACTDCGHDFEAFQSFSDDALTECPACHGTLRKVFNSVGIVFKGSGFYRTDSREKANGAGSKEAAGTEAGSKAGGEKSSTPGAGTDAASGSSPSKGSSQSNGSSASKSSSGGTSASSTSSSTAGSAA